MRRLLGLLGVALTVGACASASLVSDEQAEAIKRREQALAPTVRATPRSPRSRRIAQTLPLPSAVVSVTEQL